MTCNHAVNHTNCRCITRTWRESGWTGRMALRRVDICRWGSQWFVVSWSFVSVSLHFGTRLAVTRIRTLKLIRSYATQIGKEAGGSGPGGCSHFALVVGGDGREWQVALAFSMFLHFLFFPFLLFVAFWFEVLLHAVSHKNWYVHPGFDIPLKQDGLKTLNFSFVCPDNKLN